MQARQGSPISPTLQAIGIYWPTLAISASSHWSLHRSLGFALCVVGWFDRCGSMANSSLLALGPRSPYALLHHKTDTGNLLILSFHFQGLWHEADPTKSIDRYHGYRARVPEIVFQGWFSVSVLELLVQRHGFNTARIWPVLFSL